MIVFKKQSLDENTVNQLVRFFLEEGREIGYTFCEDMPVVFEEFEVIEVL